MMLASTRASRFAMAKVCAYSSARLSVASALFASFCASYCFSRSQQRHLTSGRQQRTWLSAELGSRRVQRGFAAAAAAGGEGASAALVDRIKSDMKDAMKAKDQARLDAIRFLNAAIKQREIELREDGAAINDQEVIKVIQKLVKQRKDSIESYRAGGREDLVAKEQLELGLLEGYLPAMMTRAEVEAVVEQVIAELGASGPKAMGAVMKAVMTRTGGRADNKTVSDLAKAKLK